MREFLIPPQMLDKAQRIMREIDEDEEKINQLIVDVIQRVRKKREGALNLIRAAGGVKDKLAILDIDWNTGKVTVIKEVSRGK